MTDMQCSSFPRHSNNNSPPCPSSFSPGNLLPRLFATAALLLIRNLTMAHIPLTQRFFLATLMAGRIQEWACEWKREHFLYRVTHQIDYYLMMTSNRKLRFSKRSLYCDRYFVLVSTKASNQPNGSPCTALQILEREPLTSNKEVT